MKQQKGQHLAQYRWKKGQSGNVTGRKPYAIPKEIQEERKRNQVGFIKLVAAYANMTREQALQRLASNEALQIEDMVQGVISKAGEGDTNALRFIVEVMAGKIPESDYDDFTDEDIEILRRIKEVREKKLGTGQPD